MKLTQVLPAALLLIAFSTAATAGSLTWVDRDPGSGSDPQLLRISRTETFQSTFNIAADGFNPGIHIIDSINAMFAFSDDADSRDGTSGSRDDVEFVDVSVGGFKIWDDLQVDGDHDNSPSSYHWVNQDLFGYTSILSDLSSDGIVSYSITIQNRGSKDTYLKVAQLTATGDLKTTTPKKSVPDGGTTVGLFGVVLLGLGAIRRKLR